MGLLSLVLAGLGQFAYGKRLRAFVLFVLDAVCAAAALQLLVHAGLVPAAGAFALWRIWAAWDAFRGRGGAAGSAKAALAGLLVGAAVFVAVALLASGTVVKTFRMQNTTMAGTIAEGEVFVVDRLAYLFREPQRGDVLVYRSSRLTGEPATYAKRLVALPGERVEFRGGDVLVDGREIEEPWRTGRDPRPADLADVTVPEGSYYVLGDDRRVRQDSRDPAHGMVPREWVTGRAGAILWRRAGAKIR
jgi:signal peptidase I